MIPAEFEEEVTIHYNMSASRDRVELGFQAFDSWWQFRLWRNEMVVSRYTSVRYYTIAGEYLNSGRHRDSDCHYIGTLLNTR